MQFIFLKTFYNVVSSISLEIKCVRKQSAGTLTIDWGTCTDGMLIYNSQCYEQLTWRYPGLPIELPLVTAHHRTDEKSDSRWGCLSTLSCLLSIPMQQITGCFPGAELTLYTQFYFQRFLVMQVKVFVSVLEFQTYKLYICIKSFIKKKYFLLRFYPKQYSTCYYQTFKVFLRLHILLLFTLGLAIFLTYEVSYNISTSCISHLLSALQSPKHPSTKQGLGYKAQKKAVPILYRIVNPSF